MRGRIYNITSSHAEILGPGSNPVRSDDSIIYTSLAEYNISQGLQNLQLCPDFFVCRFLKRYYHCNA
jgi:hypothetical protein